MRVLFIGGTGTISSACAHLAVDQGIDLFLLNRGHSSRDPVAGAKIIHADINDHDSVSRALGSQSFDAVVNWVAFVPEQVLRDVDRFAGRTKQYVFISSASAYQKPLALLPITESTPLANPFWEYSRNKIACEEALMAAYRASGFPVTIVRPSHTYDKMRLPMHGRYGVVARMRAGKPIVVHGDGTSLWVLTHHADFAVGFNGLLGNEHAIGESFHITSDELLTWDQIHRCVARAANVSELELVHVPSEVIARFDPDWGASLLGDKAHSVIFDNTKIRRIVPDFHPRVSFSEGAREIVAWFDADPARQAVDAEVDHMFDRLIEWALHR